MSHDSLMLTNDQSRQNLIKLVKLLARLLDLKQHYRLYIRQPNSNGFHFSPVAPTFLQSLPYRMLRYSDNSLSSDGTVPGGVVGRRLLGR